MASRAVSRCGLPERASAPHLVVYLHGALMQLSTCDVEARRVTISEQMLVAECLAAALAPLAPIVVIPQSKVGQGWAVVARE